MVAQGARLGVAHLLRRPLSRNTPARPVLRSFFTSSQPSTASRIPSGPPRASTLPLYHTAPPIPSRRLRFVRFKSGKSPSPNPDPTRHLGSPDSALSLSQRLKKLSREYGWAAFGVYMTLTVLDFPFCFLAVRSLGTEQIAHYEHVVIEAVRNFVRIPFPNLGKHDDQGVVVGGEAPAPAVKGGEPGWAQDIEEAGASTQGAGASIWTQLALAYAIHKSFIFIRVPLAVSITPKVVKTLRKWGWNIGKRKPKSS